VSCERIDGWIDGSSVQRRTTGADLILYTRRRKPHQLHSPDKRLPSYTSIEAPARAGQARGPRGLDLGECGSLQPGVNTGPVRAGCAYTTLSDWAVFARLLDPAAPLLEARPMRCYTIRRPPIRTHKVGFLGQGCALKDPGSRKFCCVVYRVGTPRLNGPRSEQSEYRAPALVQTYNAVGPPVSQSCHVPFLLAQQD